MGITVIYSILHMCQKLGLVLAYHGVTIRTTTPAIGFKHFRDPNISKVLDVRCRFIIPG